MTASNVGILSSPVVLGLIGLAAAALQGWLVWRLIDAMRAVRRMEERLGHFGDALTLLTETTEAGFVAMGDELSKYSADSVLKTPKRISNARLNAAARRGATVTEIAAAEQLSETEVRLRMHLSKQSAAGSKPALAAAAAGAGPVAPVTAAAAPAARTRRASASRKPARATAADRPGTSERTAAPQTVEDARA